MFIVKASGGRDDVRARRSGLADGCGVGSGRRSFEKIGTNNRLRRTLRISVARFGLSSPDAAVRLGAVQEMLRSLDEATVELLRQRAERRDRCRREVRDRDRAGAGRRSTATIANARLAAIRVTGGPTDDPKSATASRRCSRRPTTGRLPRATTRCGRRPRQAVQTIDSSRALYSAVETLFFGLSLGSVLVLVAIGLAITFGVMGVINMAHGELMMLGAYTTYVVQMSDAAAHWRVDSGGDSRGVHRRRPGRRAARAHDHPLPVRPSARDAAGDLRRQPGAAAAGAFDLLGEQSRRRDAGVDERDAGVQRSAWRSPTTVSTSSSSRCSCSRSCSSCSSARGWASTSAPCRRTARWRARWAFAASGWTR